MFTGIIETTGIVTRLEQTQGNLHITVTASIASELKIDQSVAHNGVCLTVVSSGDTSYRVTAIDETLQKTNLGALREGDLVNLERCMAMNGRLDGHIVQGHVDQTATCTAFRQLEGSWEYTFEYDPAAGNITVEKGSVCVNGISLTVVNSQANSFSVAIIPYTYEHTNLQQVREGSTVNLEFDIIGKYVARLLGRS
ncbi:riboflavin synthase [Hufsiella ginkgonis]|uniref:Riboflavin synthase n=1 Tax=Hufsiella ginkgonis TaxID=2695274 RepID=A0A7K1Y093_9SPHI|nr:riboflavin synthase [Hufsiella ginkgonis]MXV16429.1 riboflavin synthase [Hufsiella ginkgonis]